MVRVINYYVTTLVVLIGFLFTGQTLASPDIEHWKTGNGARVYFVKAMELPMVDIHVIFDAGSARDGEYAGLANLTASLLSDGAGGLDSNTIAKRFSAIGARFGASADRDMTTVTLRTLIGDEYMKPALALFNTVLTKPDFPEQDIERKRKQMLIGLQHEEQSPGSIVDRTFYKRLYGDHPYAMSPSGTTDSVNAITRGMIQSFHEKYYVSKNTVIAITGAVTKDEAEDIAKQVIKGLAKGTVAPSIPVVAALETASVDNIEHPSTQTHVRMGQPGVKRGDADYFTLYVGNHIMGGSGLVSRLNEEIREKRAMSYSVYSYFMPLRQAGAFTVGLQTKNDQTNEAIEVAKTVLQDYIDHGPTPKELESAKKNITGGFPLRISSNSKIIGYISMIGFYGLPLDYLDTFNANVNAVTIDQIKDAFKRRLDINKMVTVTVGGQP